MKYVGGKSRFWRDIIPFFGNLSNRTYVEPFVGSASVISHVHAAVRIGSDIHGDLISLLKAVQQGWEPPSVISKETYLSFRDHPTGVPDHLLAFVGFACSFGAKYYGGYASDGTGHRNYADEGRRSLLAMAPLINDVIFVNEDYRDLQIPDRSVIYCDPPYAGTQGYGRSFASGEFWDWCRHQRREGHDVWVSEFAAPDDFVSVWSRERAASLDRNTGGKRSTEHLYRLP